MSVAIEQQVEGFQKLFTRLKQEVAKVIVGMTTSSSASS